MALDTPFTGGTVIEPSSTTDLFSPFGFFSGSDPFSQAYGEATSLLFYAVGAALFIYLIWAGISYITSGSDTKKATDARSSVLNAVIGIFIFISIYTILSIALSIGTKAPKLETNQATFSSGGPTAKP